MIRQSCSLIVMGLAFIGCGALFLLFFGQSATLRCNRPEPSQLECEREVSWLGRFSTGRRPVEGLSAARVGESCDDSCTYRVDLVTAEGTVGLTSYYSSGYAPKEETADAINRFLTEPGSPLLEVNSSSGWLGVILPAAFILAGLGMILFWPLSFIRMATRGEPR